MKKVYFSLVIISTIFGCTKEVTNSSQSSGNSTSNNTNTDLPYADFTFDGKSYLIKTTYISKLSSSSLNELPKCYTDNYISFNLFDDKQQISINLDLPKKAGTFQLSDPECDGSISLRIISDSTNFSNLYEAGPSMKKNGTLNYDGNGKCIFEANLYSWNDLTIIHKIKGTFFVPKKML